MRDDLASTTGKMMLFAEMETEQVGKKSRGLPFTILIVRRLWNSKSGLGDKSGWEI